MKLDRRVVDSLQSGQVLHGKPVRLHDQVVWRASDQPQVLDTDDSRL